MTLTVTPDLKNPPGAQLLLVQIAGTEHARCGGTILAHVYGRLGDTPADCEKPVAVALRAAFKVTQDLIGKRMITAGHDRSDGGLATTVSPTP